MTDTTIATIEDMTEEEGARLIELEREVEKAMRSAGRICGSALAEIRDRKLYRASHSSFELYCIDRHGFSKTTAYRMIATANSNGAGEITAGQGVPAWDVSPEVAAISRAHSLASQRRHTTLDQPPTTIDPSPEPLQEDDDEPLPRPEGPPAPRPRNAPIGFPTSEDYKAVTGRPGGRPPTPDGAKDKARSAREGLNKIMAALNSALTATTEAEMAAAATRTERIQIAKLAAACTVEDRKTMRPEGVVSPADCDHPANRIIGNQCGKCGATRKGAKR